MLTNIDNLRRFKQVILEGQCGEVKGKKRARIREACQLGPNFVILRCLLNTAPKYQTLEKEFRRRRENWDRWKGPERTRWNVLETPYLRFSKRSTNAFNGDFFGKNREAQLVRNVCESFLVSNVNGKTALSEDFLFQVHIFHWRIQNGHLPSKCVWRDWRFLFVWTTLRTCVPCTKFVLKLVAAIPVSYAANSW